MQLIYKLLITFIFYTNISFANNCSDYFDPKKFYKAPEYLEEMLINMDQNILYKRSFVIEKKEIYRYTPIDIANEINDNFDNFWYDWGGDAYEMILLPEQVLFNYKDYYFSLKIIIQGVKGDATKYKGTIVKYSFYNYTKEVMKHINCKKGIN